MSGQPDFEALRAARNNSMLERLQRFAEELGVPLEECKHNFNFDSCFCACASGGPCEHKWDGEGWESEDGRAWSATCSRCAQTCMSHDMRNAP